MRERGDGPSCDKSPNISLIHLIDFRRRGWKVQGASAAVPSNRHFWTRLLRCLFTLSEVEQLLLVEVPFKMDVRCRSAEGVQQAQVDSSQIATNQIKTYFWRIECHLLSNFAKAVVRKFRR